MQLLTAEIFVLMVTTVDSIRNFWSISELNPLGPNVCMETETYKERIQVRKSRPIGIKTFCWNPLKAFRCEKTRWEEYLDFEVVPRSRIVHKCCSGYKKEGTRCVPQCFSGCLHGICLRPNYCVCFPGFYGPACREKCPEERWGDNCVNECNCSNSERCDKTSGCVCQSGWKGERCEFPCEDGYYGFTCIFQCKCNGHPCNHVTGECITTTTEAATTATEILPPVTTATGSSSFSDIMQILSTSETYSVRETYIASRSNEKSTTTNEVSLTEIQTDANRDSVIGLSTTTETVTSFSEVVEYESESAEESIPTESNLNVTQTADEITIMKMAREETETEIKIHLVENENFVRGGLNSANNIETEAATGTILPGTLDELNISKNKANWKNLTYNKDYINKNETDKEFIFKGKEKPPDETILKWFNFLPTLSVLSAVSFLIIIIAARWVVVNHRRKTKMVVMTAEKEKLFQLQEGVKYQSENIFWENNWTISTACVSDVDLGTPTPILRTFKPLGMGDNLIERKLV